MEQQSNEFRNSITPKRTLLFIHSMRGGGSERQLSYLANELAGRGETCLVTLDRPSPDSYALDARIHRVWLNLTTNRGGLGRGLLANIRRIRSLRRVIIDWKPNVLVSFCDTNNILALLACPASIPIVISERSDPRHQKLSRLWEWLRRIVYPKCACCIVQTDEVGNYLASGKRLSSSQFRVIPSAIQSPSMNLSAISSGRIGTKTKNLIYVGRLSKEKRIDRLLHAWAAMESHHGDWVLKIAGDGTEREPLKKLAESLGITKAIQWLSWSDDIWSLLKTAHAYCLVSQYEGFPQSMLEAMATGLPVAVLDCSPAVREVISDGVNGLIIPDESQIVASLDRLLSDESLRTVLGQNAAIRAQEYEWSKIATKWLSILEIQASTRLQSGHS